MRGQPVILQLLICFFYILAIAKYNKPSKCKICTCTFVYYLLFVKIIYIEKTETHPAKTGVVRLCLLALSSGLTITRPAGLVPMSMKMDISSLEYSVGHHKPPYELLLITLLEIDVSEKHSHHQIQHAVLYKVIVPLFSYAKQLFLHRCCHVAIWHITTEQVTTE